MCKRQESAVYYVHNNEKKKYSYSYTSNIPGTLYSNLMQRDPLYGGFKIFLSFRFISLFSFFGNIKGG
jgi:hypothetical protein